MSYKTGVSFQFDFCFTLINFLISLRCLAWSFLILPLNFSSTSDGSICTSASVGKEATKTEKDKYFDTDKILSALI